MLYDSDNYHDQHMCPAAEGRAIVDLSQACNWTTIPAFLVESKGSKKEIYISHIDPSTKEVVDMGYVSIF